MWLLLFAALGAAYGLSRTYATPSGQQVQAGPVVLRLPVGFEPVENPQYELQARDTRGNRLLVVKILATQSDGYDDEQQPIDFRGLNQTGTLSYAGRRLQGPDGEFTQLTASANIPTTNLQVVLELQVISESGANLSADQLLLRRIANSVALADRSAKPHPRDHSKDTIVLLPSVDTIGART